MRSIAHSLCSPIPQLLKALSTQNTFMSTYRLWLFERSNSCRIASLKLKINWLIALDFPPRPAFRVACKIQIIFCTVFVWTAKRINVNWVFWWSEHHFFFPFSLIERLILGEFRIIDRFTRIQLCHLHFGSFIVIQNI